MTKLGNPSAYPSSSTDDDELPVNQTQRRPIKQLQRFVMKRPEMMTLKQPERTPVKHAERRIVKQPEGISGKKDDVCDLDVSEYGESAQKKTEIVQVGEEWCTVPLELFELPDLKGILSVDVWNVCLTEEEREKLATFLPPLEDEGMFKSTVVDLLGGVQFQFGNPLFDFFDRLKGGFYQPTVSNYREVLKYLQRKEHYHSLRTYHNIMVNGLYEMQKLWEDFPNADKDEQIEIWNFWKTQKAKPLAEIDTVEIIPTFAQKDKGLPHPDIKVRILNSRPVSKEACFSENQILDTTRTGPKGLLKVKATMKGGPQDRILNSRPVSKEACFSENQVLDTTRTGPKGLLKVKATMKGGPEDDAKELATKENRANGPGPRGVLKVVPPDRPKW